MDSPVRGQAEEGSSIIKKVSWESLGRHVVIEKLKKGDLGLGTKGMSKIMASLTSLRPWMS